MTCKESDCKKKSIKIQVYVSSTQEINIFKGRSTSQCINVEEVNVLKCKSSDARLVKALKESDKDSYTIYCDNNALTLLDSTTIYNYIERIVNKRDFDIFYLADYLDRADLLDEISMLDNFRVVKTKSPHGTLCLLFSPDGKKKFLDELECNKEDTLDSFLNANNDYFCTYTSVPPMISFDITKRKLDAEVIKTAQFRECRTDDMYTGTNKSNGWWNLIWFLFILFVIIMLAIFCYKALNPAQVPYPGDAKLPDGKFDPAGNLNSYPYTKSPSS